MLRPQVLAVIAKRLAKPLMRKQPDIEKFAKRVEVTRDRIATWPSDLVVYAEHPSIFYDLMTDQLLEQVGGGGDAPALTSSLPSMLSAHNVILNTSSGVGGLAVMPKKQVGRCGEFGELVLHSIR